MDPARLDRQRAYTVPARRVFQVMSDGLCGGGRFACFRSRASIVYYAYGISTTTGQLHGLISAVKLSLSKVN